MAKISVILPFRDPPLAFFREALDSVVGQTCPDWELILVNDGSGAAATALAREYCERFSDRIRTVAHADNRNLGLRASRLVGFRNSVGEYIALLDADDLWLPTKLEEQLDLLKRQPDTGLVYGRSRYWQSWQQGGRADFAPDLGVERTTRVEPPGLIPRFLRGTVAVPAPSSIFARRSAVDASGAFLGEFPNMYEDQVFLFKMCLHTPAVVFPGTWDFYRIHDSSMTAALAQSALREARHVFLRWLAEYLHEHGLGDGEVQKALAAEMKDLLSPKRARLRRFFRKRTGRKPRLDGMVLT